MDWNSEISLTKEYHAVNPLFMSPCDSEEMMKIIKNLGTNKASEISITILKKCAPLTL